MAIEIIGQDGTIKKPITCRSCGSILTYDRRDVQTQNNGQDISGSPDGYTYVVCPKCSERVKITAW